MIHGQYGTRLEKAAGALWRRFGLSVTTKVGLLLLLLCRSSGGAFYYHGSFGGDADATMLFLNDIRLTRIVKCVDFLLLAEGKLFRCSLLQHDRSCLHGGARTCDRTGIHFDVHELLCQAEFLLPCHAFILHFVDCWSTSFCHTSKAALMDFSSC